MAFKASPSSQHQHCTDEAQKAETVLSAVIYIYIYIYIYIHIHPFTKTLLFQKYISHICMNAEKRLKQGGHTLHQPRGVAITCNFFFFSICIYVFSGAEQKGYRRRKGIII